MSTALRNGKSNRFHCFGGCRSSNATFSSDESGNPEIFVRPFPGSTGNWKLSQGGGTELLFVSIRAEGDQLETRFPQEVFTPRREEWEFQPPSHHHSTTLII